MFYVNLFPMSNICVLYHLELKVSFNFSLILLPLTNEWSARDNFLYDEKKLTTG